MTQYDPNDPDRLRTDANRIHPRPIGDPEDEVVLTDREARQGREGRPVLFVLIAGLVLALIAWAAAEFYPRGGPQTATTAGPGRADGLSRSDTTGTVPGRTPSAGGVPISPPATGSAAPTTTAPATGNTPPASDSAR
ncbi:MAG: hypothetical protein JWN93_2783 [Hyphomicrobiales bacterium]|jgi:hypothetical protein|nr:hypothetical protein [Hyphomicrobiales bacterium]